MATQFVQSSKTTIKQDQAKNTGRFPGRIGRALLTMILALVILIAALPVPLLFVATSVPLPISVALVILAIAIIATLFMVEPSLMSVGAAVVGVLCLSALALWASQAYTHTPPITDAQGTPLPNSIATLEKVELGGTDQWLIIRGQDVNKPVLLFLSGGPGASEAARVLRFNQALEEHFVVVIWEQRGCGKSYPSLNPKSDLTVEQYVSDTIELTDMLRARFDEEKIYLVGHSWGTIIGTLAAQARPDLFHAYVGTAQMVNVLETDQIIYEMMMDHSREVGDTQFVETLEQQGAPPYAGNNPIVPYATLFGREYQIFEAPGIKNEAFRRDGDLLQLMLKQPEYGWLDRVYYLLGMVNTFNAVYPQLQEMDFREDAKTLDLPVYIMLGRHDMNDPYWLPESYFNLLVAPHKNLYFFEDSGHGMIWEEPDKFHDLMVNTILPETYHP